MKAEQQRSNQSIDFPTQEVKNYIEPLQFLQHMVIINDNRITEANPRPTGKVINRRRVLRNYYVGLIKVGTYSAITITNPELIDTPTTWRKASCSISSKSKARKQRSSYRSTS